MVDKFSKPEIPKLDIPSEKILVRGANAIIINEKGQHLMMMRDDLPVFVNIGGHVEQGEDFLTALNREAKEEIEVELNILQCIGTFYKPLPEGYYPEDTYSEEEVYLCTIPEGQEIRLKEEGAFVAWLDVEPNNLIPQFAEIYAAYKDVCLNDKPPVAQMFKTPFLWDYIHSIKDITGVENKLDYYDKWSTSSNVENRRLNNNLTWEKLRIK